jgi:hypothetical protein
MARSHGLSGEVDRQLIGRRGQDPDRHGKKIIARRCDAEVTSRKGASPMARFTASASFRYLSADRR